MAIVGRLHPLLIHFPIALVIAAVAAESGAAATGDARWRTVALANLRAGAAFALIAAVAGWRLASAPGVDAGALLEWHRWLGTIAAALAMVAAAASARTDKWSGGRRWTYRIALFGAAAVVGIAAHLGGLMVWGADFLR